MKARPLGPVLGVACGACALELPIHSVLGDTYGSGSQHDQHDPAPSAEGPPPPRTDMSQLVRHIFR